MSTIASENLTFKLTSSWNSVRLPWSIWHRGTSKGEWVKALFSLAACEPALPNFRANELELSEDVPLLQREPQGLQKDIERLGSR